VGRIQDRGRRGAAAAQSRRPRARPFDSGLLVARFLYPSGCSPIGGALVRLAVFARDAALGGLNAPRSRVERTGLGVLAFAATALVVVGGWAAVVRQATQSPGPPSGRRSRERPLIAPIGATRFGRGFGHAINAATVFSF
jgi:hypothetical protein